MSSERLPFIPLCKRCEKEMVEGFIPDATYGGNTRSAWVPGEPVSSWWRGLKLPDEGYWVKAFRCPSCGSLELFAL